MSLLPLVPFQEDRSRIDSTYGVLGGKQMKSIRYMRRPEVLLKTGLSNSTLHIQISDNLFVPPVRLGTRSVGWLEHEVECLLIARAQRKTNKEIIELVNYLVKDRKTRWKIGGAI